MVIKVKMTSKLAAACNGWHQIATATLTKLQMPFLSFFKDYTSLNIHQMISIKSWRPNTYAKSG